MMMDPPLGTTGSTGPASTSPSQLTGCSIMQPTWVIYPFLGPGVDPDPEPGPDHDSEANPNPEANPTPDPTCNSQASMAQQDEGFYTSVQHAMAAVTAAQAFSVTVTVTVTVTLIQLQYKH